MKYKVGDRVRIKSLDWYNENKNEYDNVDCDGVSFVEQMKKHCGKVCTISKFFREGYHLKEDDAKFYWNDEMIEGLAEEETLIERVDDKGLPFNEWLSHKGAFHIPNGYELKDENGNVINATKIILEKKKKEYPKTYEECSLINGAEDRIPLRIIGEFTRLINARNAYWKIAGEEMGLGKPWEPDWDNEDEYKWGLFRLSNIIYKDSTCINPTLLIFPSAEMLDAFYENFKDLIEQCKELL